MAFRSAVANGNWSNPTTWNAGVIPAAGDYVSSNGFTVTIDQNINTNFITNTSQTNLTEVPVMTSNTTPSGIASTSGIWTNNPLYDAWSAFNTSTNGYLAAPGAFWLAYEFPSPKIINSYSMGAPLTNSSNSMRDWTFEGWNGTSWVVLHTVTNNLAASWGSGYISPLIGNTTPYIKYRINSTVTNTGASYASINNFRLIELNSTTSIAGGGFTTTGSVNITCTNTSNSISAGTLTCLTIASTSPSVVTVNTVLVFGSQNTAYAIIKTGNCTLNFNGILDGNSNGALFINNSTGTTNIIGTVRKTGNSISSNPILQLGTGNTLNITGNITGNVTSGGSTKQTFRSNGSSTITITGNLDGSPLNSTNDYVFTIGTNDIVNITGSVTGVLAAFGVCNTIFSNVAHYLKIVGSIIGGAGGPGVYSTSNGAINIFTGPFVSNPNGCLPFYVVRMHYQRTLGSYYEFRDNSTGGALPPAASAPAIRMNSPEVGSDLPAVSNVRFGVVYGAGSLTGTMRVPAASNVRLGVAVDATVGTGAITVADIWNVLTSSLTTSGSIGERLKNVSTVQTTLQQLAAYNI